MKLERYFAAGNKNTFLIKPIKKILQQEITNGKWLDPFANINTIKKIIPTVKFITNDLNKEFPTDYHLDALDFLKQFIDESIEGILFDPPYSVRQVSECYKSFGMKVTQETTRADFWSKLKKEIARILKPKGKFIQFGWNSNGINKQFTKKRVILIAHGGIHHDTIILVQIKKQSSLKNFL